MLSEWLLLCVVAFLHDADKVRFAETSHELLRFFRRRCCLNVSLFRLSDERSTKFLRVGWTLANIAGSLREITEFSETQRAAVTSFYSDDQVSNPAFLRFPNLKKLQGEHKPRRSPTLDLTQHRLVFLHVTCGPQPTKSQWQKLKLPDSLIHLRIRGAAPQAESLTLKQLLVADTNLESEDASQPSFNFPALRHVYFYDVSCVERCFCCLPDDLHSLRLDSTSRTTFQSLLRFRSLRLLILKTSLSDSSFTELMGQLPETLERIELINTSPRCGNVVVFSALGRMRNLQILRLKNVGTGVFDMNILRNCQPLESVQLLCMDAVTNLPEDPQTIWPQLTRSNFEVTLI